MLLGGAVYAGQMLFFFFWRASLALSLMVLPNLGVIYVTFWLVFFSGALMPDALALVLGIAFYFYAWSQYLQCLERYQVEERMVSLFRPDFPPALRPLARHPLWRWMHAAEKWFVAVCVVLPLLAFVTGLFVWVGLAVATQRLVSEVSLLEVAVPTALLLVPLVGFELWRTRWLADLPVSRPKPGQPWPREHNKKAEPKPRLFE